MGDYGDLCRDMKEFKRDRRARFGVDCPECIRLLPKANPSILLPQQRCRIHNYQDLRDRSIMEPINGY